MFLLDTNACIQLLNGTSDVVLARFSAQSPRTVAICSVVQAELLYGARKSSAVARTLDNLDAFFAPLTSHPFDDGSAEEYGRIRADLERSGTPMGGNDLMIAAIAKHRDLTLVTNNGREFRRVVGLRVVDWQAVE